MGGGAVTAVLVAIVVVVGLLLAAVAASVRVLREYERAVVFRLGRLIGQKGPGLVLLIPGIDRMVRVSLRTVTLNIPPQNVITCDNVPAHVDAVAYFRVVDPNRSVVDIEDAVRATSQIAQTTLRSVLGKADLDALLSQRERLNEDLQQIIDEQTEPWGIKVSTVEIRDVGIPSTMQRAMARQAEAERERRAKVIHAEGERQAAATLSEAAGVLSAQPAAIQLRYLQTLREIGTEQNSTIVFPLPIDMVKPLLQAAGEIAPQAARDTAPGNGELPEATDRAELPRGAVPAGSPGVRSRDRAPT
jgi:regulator of protease activity HflC (stomatin/prohibitin superfamily)